MMRLFSALLLSGLLVACGTDKKPPLPGERIPILHAQAGLEVDKEASEASMVILEPVVNAAWPQSGGNAAKRPPHLALGKKIKRVWMTDIGDGSDKESRLVTAPVVAGGRVFAANTDGEIVALNLKNGDRIWRESIFPRGERSLPVSPGLAYASGKLYATDGVGDVLAIDPQTGKTIWRTPIEQPVRTALTVQDGRVFVLTLQDETVALDAQSGAILWRHEGVHESAGLLGAPGPAVEGSVVVATYSSGDVAALRAETGQEAWTDNLTGLSEFQSRSVTSLSGFRGHAVLDEDHVIVGNVSSRTLAIHVPSGDRVWQKEFGVLQTPLVSVDSVFLLTPQNQLVALVKGNGKLRWATDLPRYRKPDSREDPIFWHGPVLAGGRLILAGSNRKMLGIDPKTGKIVSRMSLPGIVMLPPVVVDNTLLILTDNGKLAAYR